MKRSKRTLIKRDSTTVDTVCSGTWGSHVTATPANTYPLSILPVRGD